MKEVSPESGFRHRWRDFKILGGDIPHCRQQVTALLGDKKALWVGDNAPPQFEVVPASKLFQKLGQDVEHLVFDAQRDFNADAFAIAAGLVKGGGYFILLTPELDQWQQQQSPRFYRRLASMCNKVQLQTAEPVNDIPELDDGTPTPEQQQLIAAIERVATGHRNRPLVVTADRGRGKSAAFGMAAATLLRAGTKRILVTAPRLSATHALFQHAASVLPQASLQPGCLDLDQGWLKFMAPDDLAQNQPSADLLLVDEAAAIPLPLLEKLLVRYKRIAFASTVHGYEGSGKGFALRFSRVLDRHCPQWKSLQLQQPVRWAAQDPLEKFTFELLLLDAEPADVTELDTDSLHIQRLNRDELLNDEVLLKQVFGLLVSAHYRTTPTDLVHLLDAPNLALWLGWINNKPVSALLVATEGGLPAQQHEAILAGKRRPPGHLLPIAVATQCGIAEALSLRCERIVRIAVHPQLQRQQIGSRMLQGLREHAQERQVDFLGSSFGATSELLGFWRNNDYLPVRLGFRREASGGAHSVLMLQGISNPGKDVQQGARQLFLSQFPWQLREVFTELEPALVLQLSKGETEVEFVLSEAERAILQGYAMGARQYLDCLAALQHLALRQLRTPSVDAEIFVLKLSQGRSWQEVAGKMGLTGKKAVQQSLRQAVAAFLAN